MNDQHKGVASKSISVNVIEHPACDPPCSYLTVLCPSNVEVGQSIIFTVNIAGGEPNIKPTYNWSVSSGTIIKGDRTPVIEVNTAGLADREITATVKVSGLSPECSNQASCTVKILKKMQKERNSK